MEKVLAGAIRREMARDEQCVKQAAEIQQLNRLVCVVSLYVRKEIICSSV